jgi:hypothetical protein
MSTIIYGDPIKKYAQITPSTDRVSSCSAMNQPAMNLPTMNRTSTIFIMTIVLFIPSIEAKNMCEKWFENKISLIYIGRPFLNKSTS